MGCPVYRCMMTMEHKLADKVGEIEGGRWERGRGDVEEGRVRRGREGGGLSCVQMYDDYGTQTG